MFNKERNQGEGFVTIRLDVIDLFGGRTHQFYQILINNTAPILYVDELPSILTAGEVYEFDLGSNEEGLGAEYWKHWNLFNTMKGDMDNFDFAHEGIFTTQPWNMDVGEHQVEFRVTDGINMTIYLWNFTVIENSSFNDPVFDLSIVRREGDDLVFKMDMENNGFIPENVYIRVNETGIDRPISYSYESDPNIGEHVVDISNFNHSILVKVTLDYHVGQDSYRYVHKEYEFDIPEEDNGSDRYPFLLIMMVLLIISVLLIITLLLFIERTSYIIQSEIFRGGEIREGDVLSSIQDLPGITFGELSKRSPISRMDLLSTLDHLGSLGMVRPMEDGMKMRFWPMMGAFIDGPMILNRDQKMIISTLSENERRSVLEIARESDLSSRKVEKELSMLDLKGSISKKETSEGTIFYLNSRQRAKIKKIILKRT